MMMKQMNKIYSEIIQACSDGGGRSKVWKLFEDACKEDLQVCINFQVVYGIYVVDSMTARV